ncbi:hypothetical protein OXX80_001968 [Metschnikowia pulcherrima]
MRSQMLFFSKKALLPAIKNLSHGSFPKSAGQFAIQKAYASSLTPTIRQVLANPPKLESEGTARGHIKAIRTFKNVGFIDLSDGSIHETLSVTINNPEDTLRDNRYKVGQSVEIRGKWIESRGLQPFELSYDPENPSHNISIIGDVLENYPIQKKRSTLQFLRTVPTLRHRTSLLASVLRFRAHVEGVLADFFRENDVVKVAPPLITSSDCEGAGEQFHIRPTNEIQGMSEKFSDSSEKNGEKDADLGFFGKDAFMTVSTQLHLEILALSLNRVWTLTPCFRAEDSNTNRHLSEFWMLEAELCFVTEVHQLTDFVEAMVRDLVRKLQSESTVLTSGSKHDLLGARFSKQDREKIGQTWHQIMGEHKWPSITYTEAIEILNRVKNKGRSKGRSAWGASISTEDEKWLAGVHYNSPVFITDYPKSQKPFYMLQNEADNTQASVENDRATVACFDLIVPEIGELVGGSLREHNHEKLVSEMQHRGMSTEAMQWYLSTRENGSVPHGGFGMGFERLLAYLAAVDNIRDISAFPRAPNVCAC